MIVAFVSRGELTPKAGNYHHECRKRQEMKVVVAPGAFGELDE